jgi:antirestriction protein
MTESTNTVCPRIYVACLAAYNRGHLHGEWIDADQDADAIHEEIREILAESPVPGAEEWAIHDHEDFGGLRLSEFEDIERVADMGQLIAEHGPAFAAYAADVGPDHATEEGFQDAYCGQWESEVAYAEELFDELYAHDIPENLRCYVDYEKFARDLFINDCFGVDCPEGGLFVFRRC